MLLGVEGDAGSLAEIHVGRKLEQVRHRIERNLRRQLLGECGRAHQHEQSGEPCSSHEISSLLFPYGIVWDVRRLKPRAASIQRAGTIRQSAGSADREADKKGS